MQVSYHKAKEFRESCNTLKDTQAELRQKWEGRKDKQRYLKAEQEALTKGERERKRERRVRVLNEPRGGQCMFVSGWSKLPTDAFFQPDIPFPVSYVTSSMLTISVHYVQ